MTAAPDLVALAHVAAEAIARYVAAYDMAQRAVGTEAWEPPVDARVDAALSLFYLRMDGGPMLSESAKDEIYQMEAMAREYGVRPEWALRVVQIASAEAARRECAAGDDGGKVAGDG